MKKIILLFILTYATSGFSQLVLETESSVDGFATDSSVAYNFTVTNSGAETASFYWQLVRADGMPRSWEFTICDAVLCYAEGVEATNCDDPDFTNVLGAGESITFYKIGLHPYGTVGTASVEFILTQVCGNVETENILNSSVVTFNIEQGVSSVDNDLSELSDNILLYPNPTVDRFHVKNDDGVASLAVYNIVGKQIMTATHKPGQSHDVSNLDEGIYLVRMLDRTNNSLRVIRLTKD